MLDNIKDSIKAKLYDFAYTPFMSSYIISWVLLNHKHLLVYFGDSPLEKKLMYLSVYHIEFYYPLYIALIYVFIYPLFALVFYAITLFYKTCSKYIRTYVEKITPIHPDEAAKIRVDITRLEDEKDDAIKKLREKEEEYKVKLQNDLLSLQNEVEAHKAALTISDQMINTLQAEREKFTSQHDAAIDTYNTTINGLEQQLSQAKGFLASKNDECSELEKKMADMEKQLASVGIVNATVKVGGVQADSSVAAASNEPDTDFMKVVRYFYDSYNITDEESLLNELNSEKGVAKLVARDIINKLISDNVLSKDNINRILVTPEGTSKLIKTINGQNQE